MPDAIFEHPRLVAIYDALDSDRSDLDLVAASSSRPVTPHTGRGGDGPARRPTASPRFRGVGAVESWVDLADLSGPLVSFRQTWVFASDGAVLTSDSTLRFRERDEVEAALFRHDYDVDDVLDAPDGPSGNWSSSRFVPTERYPGSDFHRGQ